MKVEVKISIGDYLDRLSILEIKKYKGLDVSKEIANYHHRLINLDVGYDFYLNIIKSINLSIIEFRPSKKSFTGLASFGSTNIIPIPKNIAKKIT